MCKVKFTFFYIVFSMLLCTSIAHAGECLDDYYKSCLEKLNSVACESGETDQGFTKQEKLLLAIENSLFCYGIMDYTGDMYEGIADNPVQKKAVKTRKFINGMRASNAKKAWADKTYPPLLAKYPKFKCDILNNWIVFQDKTVLDLFYKDPKCQKHVDLHVLGSNKRSLPYLKQYFNQYLKMYSKKPRYAKRYKRDALIGMYMITDKSVIPFLKKQSNDPRNKDIKSEIQFVIEYLSK